MAFDGLMSRTPGLQIGHTSVSSNFKHLEQYVSDISCTVIPPSALRASLAGSPSHPTPALMSSGAVGISPLASNDDRAISLLHEQR